MSAEYIQTAVQAAAIFLMWCKWIRCGQRAFRAVRVGGLTSRITDTIKQDMSAALGAVTYNGKVYGMPLFK